MALWEARPRGDSPNWHNTKTIVIATGCADPSHRSALAWEALWEARPRGIPFILNIKETPPVDLAGLKKGLGLGEITDSVIRLRGADLTVLNSHII